MGALDKLKSFFGIGSPPVIPPMPIKKIEKTEITRRHFPQGYEIVDDNSVHIEMNGTVYLFQISEHGYTDVHKFIRDKT